MTSRKSLPRSLAFSTGAETRFLPPAVPDGVARGDGCGDWRGDEMDLRSALAERDLRSALACAGLPTTGAEARATIVGRLPTLARARGEPTAAAGAALRGEPKGLATEFRVAMEGRLPTLARLGGETSARDEAARGDSARCLIDAADARDQGHK